MLSQVQKTYGLGDLLLFSTDTDTYAVSLRTQDPRRIAKALKAAGSRTHAQMLKYRQAFMRVGVKRGPDGSEFGQRLKYLGLIEGGPRDYFVSRPHLDFLARNGVPLPEYPRRHGGEEVAINHTLVE